LLLKEMLPLTALTVPWKIQMSVPVPPLKVRPPVTVMPLAKVMVLLAELLLMVPVPLMVPALVVVTVCEPAPLKAMVELSVSVPPLRASPLVMVVLPVTVTAPATITPLSVPPPVAASVVPEAIVALARVPPEIVKVPAPWFWMAPETVSVLPLMVNVPALVKLAMVLAVVLKVTLPALGI